MKQNLTGLVNLYVLEVGIFSYRNIAAKSMRLRGTQQGQEKYHGYQHMLMSASGQPVYKFSELLSDQQLKAYLGRPRAQLLRQYDNILAREEASRAAAAAEKAIEAAHDIENPVEAYVKRMFNRVPLLKEKCKEFNLSSNGKKAELTERVIKYYQENGLPMFTTDPVQIYIDR